jgi:hypothetical protein
MNEQTNLPEANEPAKLTGSDLIARFRQKEETMSLVIKDDDGEEIELVLRTPKNAADYQQTGQKATAFGKMMMDRCPKEWLHLKPKDEQIGVQAYWVWAFLITPKLTQQEALEMARDCGALIQHIYGHILMHVGRMATKKEDEEIDLLCED